MAEPTHSEILEAIEELPESLTSLLDERYMRKDLCEANMRYLDPRKLWTLGGTLSVVVLVLAVVLGKLI